MSEGKKIVEEVRRNMKIIRRINGKIYRKGTVHYKTKNEVKNRKEYCKSEDINAVIDKDKSGYFVWTRHKTMILNGRPYSRLEKHYKTKAQVEKMQETFKKVKNLKTNIDKDEDGYFLWKRDKSKEYHGY